MKTLLFWCLLVALAGLPFYFIYWNLFRPVLIARLKYRLFQARDELRLKLISGEISQHEKSYSFVERICNKCITAVDGIDLVSVFGQKIDLKTTMEVQRDLDLLFNSPRPLRDIFGAVAFTFFGAACANSPGILILIAPLVIFGVTAFWFNKVRQCVVRVLVRGIGALYIQGC